MIITSTIELKIGKIYTEENTGRKLEIMGKPVSEYAFLVLEESNKEEFIEYVKTDWPQIDLNRLIICQYFYKISTD